jgi:hypothetical protein
VGALAPGLKTIAFTSTRNAITTSMTLETSKVAISSGPFGPVVGLQFVVSFQTLIPEFEFQVAFPAQPVLDEERTGSSAAAVGRRLRNAGWREDHDKAD